MNIKVYIFHTYPCNSDLLLRISNFVIDMLFSSIIRQLIFRPTWSNFHEIWGNLWSLMRFINSVSGLRKCYVYYHFYLVEWYGARCLLSIVLYSSFVDGKNSVKESFGLGSNKLWFLNPACGIKQIPPLMDQIIIHDKMGFTWNYAVTHSSWYYTCILGLFEPSSAEFVRTMIKLLWRALKYKLFLFTKWQITENDKTIYSNLFPSFFRFFRRPYKFNQLKVKV